MSNDFYDISAKMKILFPPNPQGDLAALQQMASNSQESMQPEQNFLQESVDVAPGSMPIDKDYSVTDFAALAGIRINESQKTGPAGQLKAKDNINIQPAGTTGNPTQDRLVGEADEDRITALERRIEALESRLNEGDGRKKGIHGKGHPMRKKQQAAIHANEDRKKNVKKESSSIKDELMKKLAERKIR
jgi:hypothetical protein